MSNYTRTGWILAVVSAIALTSGVASASPRSRGLVRQGAEALARGEFDPALQRFREAAHADPNDAQAVFFQGVALNRLGRSGEAVETLRRAEAMGSTHADLDFELGWALLRTGEPEAAIERLLRYEQNHPGRGQTSEFLGRAYLATGDLDAAERELNRAIERDPSLEPTASLALASVASRRGDERAARRRLASISRRAPQSPLGSVLRRYGLEQPTPLPTADKPWRLSLSVGAGWNDNVVAVPDGAALPADITDRGSAFGAFGADFAYEVFRTEDDIVTLGYLFASTIYEDSLDEADLLDHYWYADYQRRLTEDWFASMRISNQYTNIGGNSFRNAVTLRPAVSHRFCDWFTAELAYAFSTNEYFFPTSAAADRDGETHAIAITGYFSIPETELTGRVGYSHGFYATDGSDFDKDSDTVFIGLAHPLPWDFHLSVYYSHVFDDYDNPNSFSEAGVTRDDDIDAVSVELTRPVPFFGDLNARAYFRYDYINDDSNIAEFDYEQNIYSFGMTVDF